MDVIIMTKEQIDDKYERSRDFREWSAYSNGNNKEIKQRLKTDESELVDTMCEQDNTGLNNGECDNLQEWTRQVLLYDAYHLIHYDGRWFRKMD